MVIQSTRDWERHKAEVYQTAMDNVSQKKADKFIKHYIGRYDKHGRTYLDWKLALSLMYDYFYVTENVGTRWFACVGIGGTGKSTLMKNVFYWFDSQFRPVNMVKGHDNFVKMIDSFPIVDARRGICLDEPDITYQPNSKKGRKFRDIIGQARQGRLFLGVCATDLTDIPSTIFRKLDAIFFLPYLGKGMFFKDRPRKGIYILERIKRDYSTYGYKIFFKLRKEVGCLDFDCTKNTPFDGKVMKQYLDDKASNYKKDIHRYTKMDDKDDVDNVSERDKIIIRMNQQGLTQEEIGNRVGLTRGRVAQILGKSVNVNR